MKTLRYFFVAALAMVGMSINAQTVFDFDNANELFNHPGSSSGTGTSYVADGEFTTDATATIGDFSVTVSASDAEASNKNRIWATTPKLRMYNGTLTIKSTGAVMKSIVFTCGASASVSKWNDGNSVNVGTLNVAKPTITWSGEATEVVLSIAGNTQFTKLAISSEGGDTPEPPTPTIEEIDVTKALELIAALPNAGETSTEYKVKGFIVGAPEFQRKADGTLYGNVNLTLANVAGGTDLLTVYRAKNIGNANFTEDDINSIKEGDQVVFQGKLKKFVKNDVVTPELVSGFLVGGGTGIEAVKANAKFEGKMYNLAGQVVNKGYKGIVIVNGKKMLNK